MQNRQNIDMYVDQSVDSRSNNNSPKIDSSTLIFLDLLHERSDEFKSRYFDLQKAFRFLGVLSDENKIEISVYEHYLQGKPKTLAIDLSTMSGCPMSCRFCAAADIHFRRQLSEEEIISQVRMILGIIDHRSFEKITCSFQGIGEPSMMPETIINVSKKLLLLDNRVAISIATTVANPSAIEKWGESGINIDNLQISCSSTTYDQAKHLRQGSNYPEKVYRCAIAALKYPNIQKVKIKAHVAFWGLT